MIRVFEAFAGIGAQRTALENLGIEHEVVGISENDPFVIKSYTAMHGEVKNFDDITQINVDDIPEHDLFTYSFPCQDISIAGKQKGLEKDSNTRSSLVWCCLPIIEKCKPKYLMLENVKNLVGKKHKPIFDEWLEELSKLGYENHWKILNAKDYGVAQNRDRIFVVSIRKDLNQNFCFPQSRPLNKCLKDYLEDDVDEKYYLKDDIAKTFTFNNDFENSQTIGMLNKKGWNDCICRVTNINKLSPTLTTMSGGNTQPKILIKNATKKGYLEAENGDGIDLGYPDSKTRRGRVQKGCSHTLTTSNQLGVLDDYRIRKFTPLECWRLMGFSDEFFYKAQAVNSDAQLYKQAGNSIVVDVLEAIFKELFKGGLDAK